MRIRVLLPVLALAGLTGCDSVAGTGSDLSADEATTLSESMVVSAFGGTSDVATDTDTNTAGLIGSADFRFPSGTSTVEFTRTRTCPLGGQVVDVGTREREWDRDAGTGSMALALTRTHDACTRPLGAGLIGSKIDDDEQVVVTLTGAPALEITALHEWVMHERRGLQSLTMEGAVAWTLDDGRSGTCDVDIVAEFDPETHTRTVTGSVCGHTIDRTTTWRPGSMGGGPHHGGGGHDGGHDGGSGGAGNGGSGGSG